MSEVFYHSVIHGLGFFICFMIEVMWRKTIKHAFSMFYTLIKHGFFDQSERAYYPIYIIIISNHMIFLVVQFEIKKHLYIFSKTTNCTRPTSSCNFTRAYLFQIALEIM